MAIGLPLSNVLMSISQFILAGNWVWEGNYKVKLRRFWDNKAAVLFASIYVLHLLGLIYTTEMDHALKDLRIKLPLLVLPLIIASSRPVSKREFHGLIWVFIAAVLFSSIANMLYFLVTGKDMTDYRDVSIFISHIRFSLMICIAILSLLYFLIREKENRYFKVLQAAMIIWLVYFLFILKSVSGIVALIVASMVALFYFALKLQSRIKYPVIAGLLSIPLVVATFLYINVKDFYSGTNVDVKSMEEYSESGEKYEHRLQYRLIENGNFVWTYIAWNELENTWNSRSEIDFNGANNKGQPLKATLLRFLASKDLRKDANGVKALTDDEVRAIENGVANVRFMDGHNFNDRMYEIIWELHSYAVGFNPQGHSVSQRFEFWKAGWQIFKEHPVIGVGTGDIKQAYKDQYAKGATQLSEQYWLRAHNQYLTILITFGALGLTWFIVAFLYPVFAQHRLKDYFYLVFIIIALLSMINEDTLETQAGVTFIAFFNCFFLFGREID